MDPEPTPAPTEIDIPALVARRNSYRFEAQRFREKAQDYTKKADEADRRAASYDVVLADYESAGDVRPAAPPPPHASPEIGELIDKIDASLLLFPNGATPKGLATLLMVPAHYVQNTLARHYMARGWVRIGQRKSLRWFHKTLAPKSEQPTLVPMP